VPDWVVFPAGNLGNTSAFGKALVEAKDAGLIHQLPRLLAVQAKGASPFEVAYQNNFENLMPTSPETIATAIQIGNPVSYSRAIKSIRATNGSVSSVDDQAILAAKAIVDGAGIGAEPASCASIAGVKKAVKTGLIKPSDNVIAILTGHLLKDAQTTLRYHQGEFGGNYQNPPVVIDPTLSALASAIDT
jgi:threonine synthase